ncbi:hypothetical protein ACHAPU_006669 [Fusarium lateritium]
MPDGEKSNFPLKISLQGFGEDDTHVSKSPEPLFPRNYEVDAYLDANTKGIPYKIKDPNHRLIDKTQCNIPRNLIMWAKPSDLEAAYKVEAIEFTGKRPEDPVLAILHTHQHGFYVVGDAQYDQENDQQDLIHGSTLFQDGG